MWRRVCRKSEGVSEKWRMACRRRKGARRGGLVAANRVKFLAAKGAGRKKPTIARSRIPKEPKSRGIAGVFGARRRREARLGLVEALAVRVAGEGGRSLVEAEGR